MGLGETGLEQFRALTVLRPVSRPSRREEAETLPVAWRPFHVLKPILQALGWGALRGVLLSRCIPRGCVAQHTVHEEEEEEAVEGKGGG